MKNFRVRTIFSLSNIWGSLENLPTKIEPNYEMIEDMFAQKRSKAKSTEETDSPKKKPNETVRFP